MTKKEFLKTYCGKAVWCKTEELANEFLELAGKFGIIWIDGDNLTSNNNWKSFKKQTYYIIKHYNKLTYGSIILNKHFLDKIIEFKSLKTNSTPKVTFDPPKTILTLNGKKFVSIAKDEPFDKEKGVLMCLAKANGFDYDKVRELVASAKKRTPKLTDAEKVILENLLKEWKWIIRNVEGVLYLFDGEPHKSGFYWEIGKNYISLYEFNHLFQFIKWSDEEPYEIEKLLEK